MPSSGICGLEHSRAGGGVCLIARNKDFSPLRGFETWQNFLQCCFEDFASLGVSLLFSLGRFLHKDVNSEGLQLFSCKNREWDIYSWFFFHKFLGGMGISFSHFSFRHAKLFWKS